MGRRKVQQYLYEQSGLLTGSRHYHKKGQNHNLARLQVRKKKTQCDTGQKSAYDSKKTEYENSAFQQTIRRV